ncbi:hypothetical protein ACEN9F_22690 [Duganella sp. CT11-25]|uniref:hypothetical protein n=1 Tax=unclassified Duganella TaxID=2636909 RepID=UPI0039B0A12C
MSRDKKQEKQELLDRIFLELREQLTITADPAGDPFVTVNTGDGFDTFPLTSVKVESHIRKTIWDTLSVRVPKNWLPDILDELRFIAETEPAAIVDVHTRIAPATNNGIYIDLCNAERQVLKVDASGYDLFNYEDDQPFFRRSKGMTPLPMPLGVTPELELLREFINVENDDAWYLVVVFMLYCYRPGGPYAILIVSGIAGSSKSTFCRVLRSLIDPSTVATQAPPRNLTDLVIAAVHVHMIVLDNLRDISAEMSDGLCRFTHGSGLRTRSLYSNTDETLFYTVKPCILNGIGDIASQPDLLSRSIQLELPAIKVRRTEAEFNRSFAAAQPSIFAGLMDALSRTLAEVDNVHEVPDSRMADFSQWGIAVERALGWKPGSFTLAYANNQRDQMKNVLTDNALAQVLTRYVQGFDGGQASKKTTPTDLLEQLEDLADEAQRCSKGWPDSPHSLSKRLKRIAPALSACGIGLAFTHSGNRSITVSKIKTDPAQA